MARCYKCGCEKIQTVSPTVRKIRPVGANAAKSNEGKGGAEEKTWAQRLATNKPSQPKEGQGQKNKELQAAQAKVAELEKALAAAKKKEDEGGEADAGDPSGATPEETAELKKVRKDISILKGLSEEVRATVYSDEAYEAKLQSLFQRQRELQAERRGRKPLAEQVVQQETWLASLEQRTEAKEDKVLELMAALAQIETELASNNKLLTEGRSKLAQLKKDQAYQLAEAAAAEVGQRPKAATATTDVEEAALRKLLQDKGLADGQLEAALKAFRESSSTAAPAAGATKGSGKKGGGKGSPLEEGNAEVGRGQGREAMVVDSGADEDKDTDDKDSFWGDAQDELLE